MSEFYKYILDGLSNIPIDGSPGCLVLIGEQAQGVFTGSQSSDVFLAAAELGLGRVFVSAHNCYADWLYEKKQKNSSQKELLNNIKKWLINKDEVVEDDDILDLNSSNTVKEDFKKYKILRWTPSKTKLGETLRGKVIDFVKKGGALFCSATTWSYLADKDAKEFNDCELFKFLKKHVGIVMTPRAITPSKPLLVSKNKAKYSHFGNAVAKLCSDFIDASDYINTIIDGIKGLNQVGELSHSILHQIVDSVKKQCNEKNIHAIPTKDKSVKTVKGFDVLSITKLLCYCYLELVSEKAPEIINFPGDFETSPDLLDDVEVKVESHFIERVSTGLYLPAGVLLKIKVLEGDHTKWKVRIGAHTDNLMKLDSFKRWPIISVDRRLHREITIGSAFGGLIYFDHKESKKAELKIELSNVVRSPYFDLENESTVNAWDNEGSKQPGLWADVGGKHIIITVPSDCLRQLKAAELTRTLTFWDNVVETHHELRGTNPNKHKRERIVCDKQISCGYLHSGYPIATHLDFCEKKNPHFLFAYNKLEKSGSWGIFHEIGHNMQRGEWTFKGCTEVTVNIFSLHAMEVVVGIPLLKQGFISGKGHRGLYNSFFKKEPSYEAWHKKCELALYTFAQLVKHFGWDSMKKFMRSYEDDRQNNKKALPDTNQEKIDQWVIRYSKIVNKNITDQFKMWGLPVSTNVEKHVGHLEDWCPKNETDIEEFLKPN